MLIFLIPLFLFILLFFFSSIKVKLEYKREEPDTPFVLEFYSWITFFGLPIRISFLRNRIISFIRKLFKEIDEFFFSIHSFKIKGEMGEGLEQGNRQIENLKKLIGFILDRELVNLLFSNLKIKCHKLNWRTEHGLADPAYTAILNGFIWMLKGLIVRLIDELLFYKDNIYLDVVPDFYDLKISTSFSGIFSVRVGNIMFTMIKVFLYRTLSSFKFREYNLQKLLK